MKLEQVLVFLFSLFVLLALLSSRSGSLLHKVERIGRISAPREPYGPRYDPHYDPHYIRARPKRVKEDLDFGSGDGAHPSRSRTKEVVRKTYKGPDSPEEIRSRQRHEAGKFRQEYRRERAEQREEKEIFRNEFRARDREIIEGPKREWRRDFVEKERNT